MILAILDYQNTKKTKLPKWNEPHKLILFGSAMSIYSKIDISVESHTNT